MKKKSRELTAKVVSTKMKDTIVVVTERFLLHPLYKKPMRRTKRLSVHAPGHTVQVGDVVSIREVKPVSKTKHFQLIQ
jgi:small subunit ribosomal protein S17